MDSPEELLVRWDKELTGHTAGTIVVDFRELKLLSSTIKNLTKDLKFHRDQEGIRVTTLEQEVAGLQNTLKAERMELHEKTDELLALVQRYDATDWQVLLDAEALLREVRAGGENLEDGGRNDASIFGRPAQNRE
jgi:hypothetical protein